MENSAHNEYILWGYKVIENGDQPRQPVLIPIYRVVPSEYSDTKLSIVRSTIADHQCQSAPTPSLSSISPPAQHQAISTPMSPSPSSVNSPSISMQPPSLSRQSSISALSTGGNDSTGVQKNQIDDRQPRKINRQQYSPEVTKHLKQAFVDTVGHDRKLTKALRKKIMHETGLNSRNLTYWFSNRKRRPPFLGQQYKEAVIQSRGQVKTYEDFELWWALSKKKK
ncbi:hypothetical protein BCR42DRAFT_427865 [Absidia repens]|uniref:Homeobox domain-containing protein n=1 Tax=Absidia repens TaxID=90262 RepID=A0A1X2HZ87_9FUNG|nr:hypothetical protein BCR42DRAFT_427865 [Absidia repens]